MPSPRLKVVGDRGPEPASGLLETKLHPPPARENTIRRERLLAAIRDAGRARLLLVSAPAGFGKSTLVASWVTELDAPFAWLSLEEDDADPERFVRYLVASIRTVLPDVGGETVSMLELPEIPETATLLTPLLNDLAGVGRFVLVLDDYHVLSGTPVDTIVRFLVDNLPATVLAAIATRSDPDVPLPRLRARGELIELRAEDLRFTADEASAFFSRTMGLDLSGSEVAIVEEKTEGWAAGLQLAALSLRGRDDRRAFLDAFSGSNRYVIDYLVDEVLAHLDDELRDFVLSISVLPRFRAQLCDAVTNLPGAAAKLDRLESENLFLIPLDDTRTWYRFHHLFGDLVRRELDASAAPGLVASLHERASDWLAAHGLPEEALDQACQAGSRERALRILETAGRDEMVAGNIARVARWFERVPLDWLEDDVALLFDYATTLYGSLRIREFVALLVKFEQIAERSADARTTLFLQTLHLLRDTVGLPPAETLERGRALIGSVPRSEFNVRAIIGIVLGLNAIEASTLEESKQWLEDALSASLENDHLLLALVASSFIGWSHYVAGNIDAAEAEWDRTLAIGGTRDGVRNPAASVALAGRAGVALDRHRLDEAREFAREAIEAGRVGIGSGRVHALIHLAWIELCAGNVEEARTAVREVDHFLHNAGGERGIAFVEVLGIRMEIEIARREAKPLDNATLDDALRRLSRLDETHPNFDVPGETRQILPLTLGRIHLLAGQHSEALEVLDRTIALARTDELDRDLCEALIQRAWLFLKLRDDARATDDITTALEVGAKRGYVSTFARYRDELPPLLRLVDADRIAGAAFTKAIREACGNRTSSRLDGMLSEREREILSEVANGRSNASVAEALFISPQTVKKHLENIYAKLGVRNRTEAVAVARREGLIDP